MGFFHIYIVFRQAPLSCICYELCCHVNSVTHLPRIALILSSIIITDVGRQTPPPLVEFPYKVTHHNNNKNLSKCGAR